MQDELPTGADGTEGPEPDSPASIPDIPPLPAELSDGEAEVRRLVEAGAGSPEELRALAARLEEQRTREHSMWRQEVRPALIESKKRRYSLGDLRPPKVEGGHGVVMAGLAFAAVIVLLMIANQTSFLLLVLPVVGVLVYAWVEGQRGDDQPRH